MFDRVDFYFILFYFILCIDFERIISISNDCTFYYQTKTSISILVYTRIES